MKKLTAAVVFLSLLVPTAVGAAGKPTIAVYPAIVGSGVSNFDGRGLDLQELTRRLEEALRATRRFTLFERDQAVLEKWKLEGDIAESHLAREHSTEFGKLNNVHLIVQPMVVQFELNSSFTPVDGLAGCRTDERRHHLAPFVVG